MTSSRTSPPDEPRPTRRDPDEEQADLLAWTQAAHDRGMHDYWCTPAEAAEILQVSPERVRQLIYGDRPTLPAESTPGGRLLLRRADIEWAVRHLGPPGDRNRWQTIRRTLVGEQGRPPSRRHLSGRRDLRSERINALPWDQIIVDYQAGTPTTILTVRYEIGIDALHSQLRRRGIRLRRGRPADQLRYSDDELRQRYEAGATYAQLAADCGVSTTLVWRRIRRIRPAQPAQPAQTALFPAGSRKDARQERGQLDAWTYADHRKDPDPYWCTAADAARLLNLSRDRVRQLIEDNVLPTERTSTNRQLIRTADIRIALQVLSRDSGGRLEWRRLGKPSEHPPS